MKGLINVTILCLPTGEALWMDCKTPEYLKEVISEWKKQHPEFKETKCSMGAVQITMPESVYKTIQTNDTFNWPNEKENKL